MSYKYELHCHTKEVSRCGAVPAAEIVKMYKENGIPKEAVLDYLLNILNSNYELWRKFNYKMIKWTFVIGLITLIVTIILAIVDIDDFTTKIIQIIGNYKLT